MRSASCAALSCEFALILLLALLAPIGAASESEPPGPAQAPYVVSTSPTANETGVALDAVVVVMFSEPMDQASLLYAFSPLVPAVDSWPQPDTLWLTPSAPGFTNCTAYDVQVYGRNLSGEPIVSGPAPNPWSFMTTCDRPFILATNPANDAVNVSPAGDIVVDFSEEMKCITMSLTFVPQLPQPATFDSRCMGNSVTWEFTGGTAMESGVRYTVTVAGQGNATGKSLASSFVPNPFSFLVNVPPVIVSLSTSAVGCLDSGSQLGITWSVQDEFDSNASLLVELSYEDTTMGGTWVTLFGPVSGRPSPDTFIWTLPALDITTQVRLQVTDSAGAVTAGVTATFRIDTGAPRVVWTNPQNDEANVSLAAAISILFSEPMDNVSVAQALVVDPPLIAPRYTWTVDGNALTIQPATLPDRTTFIVTIAGSASDTCGPGKVMGADYAFRFSTDKAPSFPPGRLLVTRLEETSVSLSWDPVEQFVTGRPIPANAVVLYRVFRSQDESDFGQLIAETNQTTVTDGGLLPSTTYVYRVVAFVDGEASDPSAHVTVRTLDPFFSRTEGRFAIAVVLAAVGTGGALWARAYVRRRKEEEDARWKAEIEDVVDRVRRVRAEPDPVLRRAQEEELQVRFRALVEGGEAEEGRTDPRLERLYRALAQALVHSPEVDVAQGRRIADARLGELASVFHTHGAAYRLLSEAEASVQSELFRNLPPSARKALLLVYFYALEDFLSRRLRALVPAGATILLGERGHINARRKGWEAQWAALSLGTLLYLADKNRHFFIADEERWETEVEPLLRETVEARNRTAHPLRDPPPLNRVRDLVYGAFSALIPALRKPRARLEEEIRGTIVGALSPKAVGSTLNLYFTDRRIVVARAGVSWAAAGGVGGALGGILAARAKKAAADQAATAPAPQQILESHAKNREVPYDSVSRVVVKRAWTIASIQLHYADGKKETFEFPKQAYEDAKDFLTGLFAGRIETEP